MASSSSVNIEFIPLLECVSSHIPVTLVNIMLGFFLCIIFLSLWMFFSIIPNKYEARMERHELEAEISEIRRNDRDGWSKKLIEKKKLKLAALEKKIGRLESLYWVIHFLSMFLFFGEFCIALQITINRL
ncbi:hypothetical protein MKW98_019647 [Papaver atlanticum]|uniref:Uncharacterized protein n=1 Tax=Papaver atlanticum TaxID=357466 RepID=A0AAD4XAA8_9MAGN|nr:hypothetical protein MKW98_019647 [Papaver atlanticum]